MKPGINPVMNLDVVEMHRLDLLREAEAWHLIEEARAASPRSHSRIASVVGSYLGGLLIAAGLRLKDLDPRATSCVYVREGRYCREY